MAGRAGWLCRPTTPLTHFKTLWVVCVCWLADRYTRAGIPWAARFTTTELRVVQQSLESAVAGEQPREVIVRYRAARALLLREMRWVKAIRKAMDRQREKQQKLAEQQGKQQEAEQKLQQAEQQLLQLQQAQQQLEEVQEAQKAVQKAQREVWDAEHKMQQAQDQVQQAQLQLQQAQQQPPAV